MSAKAFSLDRKLISCPFIFFSNGIGDAILSLPTMRALSHIFNGNIIIGCERNHYVNIFHDVPCRKFLFIDSRWDKRTRWFNSERIVLECSGVDAFLSLVPWWGPSLQQLVGDLSCSTIGFFAGYDKQLPLDYSIHEADLVFSIAKYFQPDLKIEMFAWPLSRTAAGSKMVRRLRDIIPQDKYLVAVHADSLQEKMWPARHFSALLRMLLDRFSSIFIIIVGFRDIGIFSEGEEQRVFKAHGLSLDRSLSLLAACDFFVGIDSSMLHAADLCGVPGVGLFGPTKPAEFGYRFAPHYHFWNEENIESVLPQSVAQKITRMLQEHVLGSVPRRLHAKY